MKWNYILFIAVGILSFYITGFLLGTFSDTYGFGIHGFEAVPFMLFVYAVLLAAGLIVSKERSRGFVAKAFAAIAGLLAVVRMRRHRIKAYHDRRVLP